MPSADLRALTIGDFEPRKDESFVIRLPQGELALKLVQVRPLGDSGRAGGAFSLWFVSAPGPFLPQKIYPVEHPDMGQLDIFLVPLGPREAGNLYESIFT
jgi:uncharacterized protein DUF6916